MQQARQNMMGMNAAAITMSGNVQRLGGNVEAFATNPVNQLSESIRKGELNFKQMSSAMHRSGQIARRQKGLMNSYRGAIQDASGNARVFMDVQGGMARATTTAMDRIRVMGGVMRGFAGHLVKVGKNIQWAGRQITVGLTVPLAFAAWTAAKQAEEFDAEMTRLVKVYNFASEDIRAESALLKKDINDLTRSVAENFGYMAQQTTEVAANFAQMGVTGQRLIGMTSEALRIARLGEIDLATSTELVRTTMNVWGGDIEDLTNTLNRFNMIENETGLSTAELAEGIPILASVTQRLGLSAEQAAASLAVMREGGIETKQAATALRTGLVRLTDATPEARKKLSAMGINIEKVWGEAEGDVLSVIENIADEIDKFSDDLQTQRKIVSAFGDLFGLRQADRIMRLFEGLTGRAEEGTVAQRAFAAAMASNEEAAATAAEEMRRWQESAAGTAELLRSQLSVEVARFGQQILGFVNSARQLAVNILRWFNDLGEGTQKMILYTTGLVAALGPATMLIGLLANAVGQFLTVLTRLLPSMSILTTEQAAQKLAIQNNAFAMLRQSEAANMLAASQGRLAAATTAATAAQAAQGGGRGIAAATDFTAKGVVPQRVTAGAGAAAAGGGFFSRLLGRGGGQAATSAYNVGAGPSVNLMGAAANAGKVARFLPKLLKFVKIAGPIGVIATILGSIIDHWDRFTNAVSEALSGPLASLTDSVDKVAESFEELVSLWNDPAFDDVREAINLISVGIAELAGRIVGAIGGIVVTVFSALADAVNAVIESIKFLLQLAMSFAKFLEGDFSGAWNMFLEAGKSALRALINLLAGAFKIVTGVLDAIGKALGQDWGMTDEIDDFKNQLNESSVLSSNIKTELSAASGEIEGMKEAMEDFNTRLDVARGVHEELIAAGKIEEDLTYKNVAAAEGVTAEQKQQLYLLLENEKIQRKLSRLDEQRASLVEEINNTDNLYDKARLQGRLSKLDERRRGVVNEILTASQRVGQAIEAQEEANKRALDAEQERQQNLSRILSAIRSSVSETYNDIETSAMRVFNRQKEAIMDGFSAQKDAMKDRFDAQREQIKDTFDAEMEAIDEARDSQLEALDKVQEEEEKLDKLREEAFQKHKARLDYLSGAATSNIELQAALAGGDLAQAAMLRVRLRTQEEQFYMDQLQGRRDAAREARKEELDAKRDEINEKSDAEKELLEDKKDRELDALDAAEEAREAEIEAAKDAAEEQLEIREHHLKEDLEQWKKHLATTEGEFQNSLGELNKLLGDNKVPYNAVIDDYRDYSRDEITNGFKSAMDNAEAELANEEKWKSLGETIADGFGEGFVTNMAQLFDDVVHYLETGQFPAGSKLAELLPGEADVRNPEVGGVVRHSGGSVPFMGGAPGLKRDEVPSILQSGEYVIQRDAAKKLGARTLEMLNNFHAGGLVGLGGAAATSFMATLAQSLKDNVGSMFGQGAAVGDTSMSRIAGSTFTPGGKWPPRQWGVLSSNTRAAQGFIQNSWQNIKSAFAGLERGDPKSDHSWGKAIDVMVTTPGTYSSGDEIRTGWQIANWFTENADKFGTDYVIWQKGINTGTGWREYTRYGDKPGPTLGHYDHVHLSFLHDGGFAVPQLAKGASVNYDNTLANLHKGETVLTSSLSDSLQQGIRNMESGGGDTYVTIEVNGANMDEKQLAKKVRFELDKMDRAKGGNRRI